MSAVVVMVPLSILLWLQYRWQQDLERTSIIARQAAFENYLGVIAKEVKYHYLGTTERVLNLSAGAIQGFDEEAISLHFKRRDSPLVSRYFVVSFLIRGTESVHFFDAATERLFVPELDAEVSAVNMAVAPWRVLHKKGDPVDDSTILVEERDKAHRIIQKPLTDQDSRLVGMVGMILDQDHFRTVLLPEVVAGALPEFKDQEQLRVSVRDRKGHWIFGEPAFLEPLRNPRAQPIFASFLFVFRDWRVYLIGANSTPQDWARANFAFNLSLTVVLSILVLGGLALLLRSTSHEMRLSEMKNDFVSNVSHELRTPLASIRVFGELLRLGKVTNPHKVREYGDYIEAESRRLTQLINNILDFSSIESGNKVYSFEELDLSDVVRQMLETWRILLEHQSFTISYESHDDVLKVKVDADAIGQALFNLIDNAVKYSGSSRHIEIGVYSLENEAVVKVVDHGIGISRTEQNHIFDRFHRVGSGLAHDVKGSGLGLSLVQHIACMHRGRVEVSSNLGQGSTFSLHLPLSASVTNRDAPASSRPAWRQATPSS